MENANLQIEVDQAILILQPEFDPLYNEATQNAEEWLFLRTPSKLEKTFAFVENMERQRTAPNRFLRVSEQMQEALIEAKAFLYNADVRAKICAALKSITGDALDLSKVIVPVLLTLKAAGSITVPLLPWGIGFVALLISRAGIAGFCEGIKTSPQPGDNKAKTDAG